MYCGSGPRPTTWSVVLTAVVQLFLRGTRSRWLSSVTEPGEGAAAWGLARQRCHPLNYSPRICLSKGLSRSYRKVGFVPPLHHGKTAQLRANTIIVSSHHSVNHSVTKGRTKLYFEPSMRYKPRILHAGHMICVCVLSSPLRCAMKGGGTHVSSRVDAGMNFRRGGIPVRGPVMSPIPA